MLRVFHSAASENQIAHGVALTTRQDFDPWGTVRAGSMPQTTLSFTGQQLDGTGLLDYHARMYDPVLARFVSADSVVPSSASGSMDGVALKRLTVDFHEPGFAGTLNRERVQPFWFQLRDDDKQQAGSPWGPQEAQALNRYSYVQNAPVRWTDPTGHSVYMSQQEALSYANVDLTNLINALRSTAVISAIVTAVLEGGGMAAIIKTFTEAGIGASMAAMAAPYVLGAITIALAAGLAVDAIIGEWANQLDTYKDYIKDIASSDKVGVIISWDCADKLYCRATIVGRSTGNGYTMGMSKLAASFVVDWGQMDGHGNSLWEAGRACTMTASNPSAGNYYSGDNRLCR